MIDISSTFSISNGNQRPHLKWFLLRKTAKCREVFSKIHLCYLIVFLNCLLLKQTGITGITRRRIICKAPKTQFINIKRKWQMHSKILIILLLWINKQVSRIIDVLKNTASHHNGFPVVDNVPQTVVSYQFHTQIDLHGKTLLFFVYVVKS